MSLRNRSEGVLVRAKPMGQAERICRRLVREVRVIGDGLWLDADPTQSSNTILVKRRKG
jgi:hypothetical protein